ncbi:hypothetical protein, partial [Gemmatimonas sp.]|uniref:hypothetical protein n=1 Tax=Gemmatimonas sp. TaxID=1962908 RepID=UPI00356A5D89
LETYSPGRATATVLARQLSRRDGQSAGQVGRGGVLSDLLERCLATQQSTITVRSGAGTTTLSTRDALARLEDLTYGLGTQYLLTVRRPE